MCDTITIAPRRHYEPKSPKKFINICEPDNGYKAETPADVDYKQESERLKTFRNWKNDAVTPEALAKAGFYFLNANYDLVKCAFCNAEICRWEPSDDPLEEHAKWSPNCPFVKEKRRQTMSLPTLFAPLPAGQDVCGSREFFPHSVPEDKTFKLLKKIIRSYEDFKSRLETFSAWPKSLKQKPKDLAEAGFYYKGIGDHTLCFSCGGGLKNWEESDDPWEQHALWFPTCEHLLACKGQEFVDEVQSRLKAEQHLVSTKEGAALGPAESKRESGANTSDESKVCKICYSNGIEVVFIPCGHLLACVECSLSMKDVCPVCRKRIEATMRVFPS